MENLLKKSNQTKREKIMDRAKVICHMITSIDGKIQNSFYSHPDVSFAGDIYEKLNYSYGQAIGIGRNTVDSGRRPDLSRYKGISVAYKDRIITDDCTYGVVFDRFGKMCWDGKYQEYEDIPKRRIIEVLTEKAAPEYLAYLNELEIPYLFGGQEELDLELVLHKLKRDYNINTMVLGGGARLNAAFMAADLVDEISLVIAPGVNGGRRELSLVGTEDNSNFPKFFKLKEVQQIGHNSLILRYKK